MLFNCLKEVANVFWQLVVKVAKVDVVLNEVRIPVRAFLN